MASEPNLTPEHLELLHELEKPPQRCVSQNHKSHTQAPLCVVCHAQNDSAEVALLRQIVALFDAFADDPIEDIMGPPGNHHNELRRTLKFGYDVGALIAVYQQRTRERLS